ncbi:MAG: HAMP domain-containing protein [Candidatus Staskawiczbacteria bacterium]|nr:HAMP domain-containing protein [Candidatus Staskawiczbacteria bacterium]
MAKLRTEIATPIILSGIFAIVVFFAIYTEHLEPYFSLIILFLIIYVLSFGVAIGQTLASPIKKILERAKELTEGNLSTRVYLETKGELAELAEAFNKIAEELEESHEQGKNEEKSVSIKVKARTKDLEETISALEQKIKNRTIELERMTKEIEGMQSQVKDSALRVSRIAELEQEIKPPKLSKKNSGDNKNPI